MISFGFLLFGSLALAGAYTVPFPDGRIVGGISVNITTCPYQVSLQRNDRHFCGGSIVGRKWVLTARHCTHNFNSGLAVRAGSTSRSWGGSYHKVVAKHEHPKYNPSTVDYDFSLLEVTPEFTLGDTRQIIPLTTAEPKDGIEVMVSGWGTTSEGGTSTDTLMAVRVETVDRTTCNSAYDGRITERMICAAAPNKDSCQGDSGGPLVDRESGVQVGVVSWGVGCARPNKPGIYSNIKEELQWIQDTMNE